MFRSDEQTKNLQLRSKIIVEFYLIDHNILQYPASQSLKTEMKSHQNVMIILCWGITSVCSPYCVELNQLKWSNTSVHILHMHFLYE